MKLTSETIVFFGSGPVAAKSLDKLAVNFDIEAVITKPRPAHHKHPFPVIELANKLGLQTYTPKNRSELNELFSKVSLKSRVGVVIDYGIILPAPVIDYFPLGVINSHFSLLPKYRGADPISFAILGGDNKTGVSLMLLVPALDEGPLLAQKAIDLANDTTAPGLTDELIGLSDLMLSQHLPEYLKGNIAPRPQGSSGVSYTRKLTKADSILDWQKPAAQLEREIRAFYEWPRSRTELGGVKVIVTKAHAISDQGKPGKIRIDNKKIGVFTSQGILVIDRLILEGKKEMDSAAFLAGHPI